METSCKEGATVIDGSPRTCGVAWCGDPIDQHLSEAYDWEKDMAIWNEQK